MNDIALLRPAPQANSGKRSASDIVFYGILQHLEEQKIVPGQRLVEVDLCQQFGVGRNSVREALKRLEARGIIDLNPHRGASVRGLSDEEALALLDVAEVMTGLAARLAARSFHGSPHAHLLREALDLLQRFEQTRDEIAFSRARRLFYRAMLTIGANQELIRLFPSMQVHTVHFQFQSEDLQKLRFVDYSLICQRIMSGDEDAAEQAGRQHVANIKRAVRALKDIGTSE